jgi:hypothetical protein
MYKLLSSLALLSLAFSGNQQTHAATAGIEDPQQLVAAAPPTPPDTMYSKPIHIDSANRMIMSYLNAINYTVNTNETRSLIFDANVLKNYLNTGNGQIKKIKFIFAHNMNYINSGFEGERPSSNDNALTLIIVGVDGNGNYVFDPNQKALDFCQPCPTECLQVGSAANNLLVAP